jgi:hypothetical protein
VWCEINPLHECNEQKLPLNNNKSIAK